MRYVLFVFLTLGLTGFIGWSTYQTDRLLRQWQPDRNLLLLPAENALRVGLVVMCLGLGWLSGLPPETLGWTSTSLLVDLLVGIGSGVMLSLVLTVSSMAAVRRWGRSVYSPVVVLNVLPDSRRQWLGVLLALIPVAALEELLFRSLLLGGLSPILPAWFLVPALALVFGLMHLPQGRLGVAGTGLAGLVFSLLFVWRTSVLVPLVAHYVADVLQLVQANRTRQDLARLTAPGHE